MKVVAEIVELIGGDDGEQRVAASLLQWLLESGRRLDEHELDQLNAVSRSCPNPVCVVLALEVMLFEGWVADPGVVAQRYIAALAATEFEFRNSQTRSVLLDNLMRRGLSPNLLSGLLFQYLNDPEVYDMIASMPNVKDYCGGFDQKTVEIVMRIVARRRRAAVMWHCALLIYYDLFQGIGLHSLPVPYLSLEEALDDWPYGKTNKAYQLVEIGAITEAERTAFVGFGSWLSGFLSSCNAGTNLEEAWIESKDCVLARKELEDMVFGSKDFVECVYLAVPRKNSRGRVS